LEIKRFTDLSTDWPTHQQSDMCKAIRTLFSRRGAE